MPHLTFYITISLLFGFFIESIFGFAGTVISLAILGFYVDIKTLIFLILYVATWASIFVVITDFRSFSQKQYLEMISLGLPGAMIGALLFNYLSSVVLLKILAIFLLILAIQSFYEAKFKKTLKKVFLFLSGIIHGIFGLGGVTAIGIMKNEFKDKSELRITFAVFFISLNLIRGTQYFLQNSINYQEIINYWWIPLPLFISIQLGHKIHLKISEHTFKKGISILLLITGSLFLFR